MYGGPDLTKQARAEELFRKHTGDGLIVMSTQVVQEFYSAGSRKLRMPRRELNQLVSALLDLPMVNIDGAHILLATEVEERYKISFWDALIVTAATSAEAATLYSEDLKHRQKYGDVTVLNPFTN